MAIEPTGELPAKRPEATEDELLFEKVIGIANDSRELTSEEMDKLEAKLRSEDTNKSKAAIQAALDEQHIKRDNWNHILDTIEFITGTKIPDLDRSKIITEVDLPTHESVDELEKRGSDILHQKNQG